MDKLIELSILIKRINRINRLNKLNKISRVRFEKNNTRLMYVMAELFVNNEFTETEWNNEIEAITFESEWESYQFDSFSIDAPIMKDVKLSAFDPERVDGFNKYAHVYNAFCRLMHVECNGKTKELDNEKLCSIIRDIKEQELKTTYKRDKETGELISLTFKLEHLYLKLADEKELYVTFYFK